MPLADHPLLSDPSLTALILHAAAEGPVEPDGLADRLDAILRTAGEAPAPRGQVRPHLHALCGDLCLAGLLRPGLDAFVLTVEGRAALREHPSGLDRADLMAFPAYADHVHRTGRTPRPEPGPHDGTHPQAYFAGGVARSAGLSITDNPYPAETADHLAWENGWAEAET